MPASTDGVLSRSAQPVRADTSGTADSPAARFAVIDLETTGLDPSTDRVLEIAVVALDVTPWGGTTVTERWHTLVHPDTPVRATHIHGITDDMVTAAPGFPTVVTELRRRLAGRVPVAHNLAFDAAFLDTECQRHGLPAPRLEPSGVCTLRLVRAHLPGRAGLVAACRRLGLPHPGAHTALGDALAAARLLGLLIARGVRPGGVPYPNGAVPHQEGTRADVRAEHDGQPFGSARHWAIRT
jgi:DNA polymerase III epsilon subunit-like protein